MEALGRDFQRRGRVIEEQIEVLRLLWSKEVVSYKGTFHTITEAGLNPLPVNHAIPIWMGGSTEVALKRVARLGDGWMPLEKPDEHTHAVLERLRGYMREAGRDPNSLGIEGHVHATSKGAIDELVRQTNAWRDLGATHVMVNMMGVGYTSPDEHIEAIRFYKEAIAR
jgi:alkanesulfonate monooxygenase SsuD/methylene tetrahydromethanopterin reductase-like flavin-dependent oxidoreductase (luciferase family)